MSIKVLIAVGCVAAVVAKRTIHAHHAMRRQHGVDPRNIASTSAQPMMCSVLALKMASTLRSGQTLCLTSRTVGGRRLRAPSSFTRDVKIGEVRQLLRGMPRQMSQMRRKMHRVLAGAAADFQNLRSIRQRRRATPRVSDALFRSQASEKGSIRLQF